MTFREQSGEDARTSPPDAQAAYHGIDVADRGADPEGDATRTPSETEHLLATWIVKAWQNRRLNQYAPAWIRQAVTVIETNRRRRTWPPSIPLHTPFTRDDTKARSDMANDG
ncbi:hypothetical protein [Streptomyces cyaneofuscatus]|uniref:hypothetical protein n=1 Tax=Streptomyces cyaneofuscatus TaxID=66883 RepID=UPI0036523071